MPKLSYGKNKGSKAKGGKLESVPTLLETLASSHVDLAEEASVTSNDSEELGAAQITSETDSLMDASTSSAVVPLANTVPAIKGFSDPVECWDASGTRFLRRFPSIRIATMTLSIPHPQFIVDCMRGSTTTAYGFQWKSEASTGEHGMSEFLSDEELLANRDPALTDAEDVSKAKVTSSLFNGTEKMHFSNIAEAAKFSKVTKMEILECIYGERKSLKRRVWKLVFGDYETQDAEDVITPQHFYEQKSHLPIDCWAIAEFKILKEFADANDVAERLFMDAHAVIDCCVGRRSSLYGFKFRFKDNPIIPDTEVEDTPIEELMRIRKPPLNLTNVGDGKLVAKRVVAPIAKLSPHARVNPIPIDCWSKDGSHMLYRFNSLNELKQMMHFAMISDITKCCQGTKEHVIGFRWKFANLAEEVDSRHLVTIKDLLAMRNPPYKQHNTSKSKSQRPKKSAPPSIPPEPIDCWTKDGNTFLRRFNSVAELMRDMYIREFDLKEHMEGDTSSLVGFRFKAADYSICIEEVGQQPLTMLRSLRDPPAQQSKVMKERKAPVLPPLDFIDCWTLDGDTLLRRFTSREEIMRELAIKESDLVDHMDGKTPSLVGFLFKPIDCNVEAYSEDVLTYEQLRILRDSSFDPVFPANSLAERKGAGSPDMGDRHSDQDSDSGSDSHGYDIQFDEAAARAKRLSSVMAVDCWSVDGTVLYKRFSSLREAKKVLRITDPQMRDIKQCCRGLKTSVLGFKWTDLDESIIPSTEEMSIAEFLTYRRPPLLINTDLVDAERTPILCTNPDGTEPMSFKNITDATKHFTQKSAKGDILDCCFGARKNFKHKKFEFVLRDAPPTPPPSPPPPVERPASPSFDGSFSDNEQETVLQVYHPRPPRAGIHHMGTAVDCWSTDKTKLLRRFRTITEAMKSLQLTDKKGSIKKCCQGQLDSAYGFIWTFRDDSVPDPSESLSVSQIMQYRDYGDYSESIPYADGSYSEDEGQQQNIVRPPSLRLPPHDLLKSLVPLSNAPDMRDWQTRSNGGRIPVPVECWSKDGTVALKRFDKISEALQALRIPKSVGIKECCEGRVPTAHGFVWKFSEPFVEVKNPITLDELRNRREPPLDDDEARSLRKRKSFEPTDANNAREPGLVDCSSNDGEQRFLRRFESLKDIVRDLHLHRRSTAEIRDCIHGVTSSAFGFVWKHADDSFLGLEEASIEDMLLMRNPPYYENSNVFNDPPEAQVNSRVTAAIDCWSIDGTKLLKRFESTGDALRTLDLPRRAVAELGNCCLDSSTTAYGFVWKFRDDSIELAEEDEISLDEFLLLRVPPIITEDLTKPKAGPSATPVDCWTPDGTVLLRRFPTMTEGLRAIGYKGSTSELKVIKGCAQGIYDLGFGLKWTFKDESIEMKDAPASYETILQYRDPPYVAEVPAEKSAADGVEALVRQMNNSGRTPIPVDCLSHDGSRILHRFPTISHALKALHIGRFADIKECLLGNRADAYGFQWKCSEKDADDLEDELTIEELQDLRDPPLTEEEQESYRTSGRSSVAVDCWNLDGTRLLKRFASIAEVKDSLQLRSTSDVRDCCQGAKESAFGFTWKFYDRSIKMKDSEQMPVEALILLRDPPLSKHTKKFTPRDNMTMPVDCLDKDGNLLLQFASVKDASKACRVEIEDILDCCYGLVSSLMDKKWQFAEVSFKSLAHMTVDCIALNGETIHRFANDEDAAEQLQISSEGIVKCCTDFSEHVKGLRFRYTVSKEADTERAQSLPRNILCKVVELGGIVLSDRAENKGKSPVKRRNNNRDAMMDEGWLFESEDNENIGSEVRKFYTSGDAVDGVVEAFMPAEDSDTVERWHVRYADGDTDEVERDDLIQILNNKILDVKGAPALGSSPEVHVSPADEKAVSAVETEASKFLQQRVHGPSDSRRPFEGPDYQAIIPSMNTCSDDGGCFSSSCSYCKSRYSTGYELLPHIDDTSFYHEYLKSVVELQLVPGNVIRICESGISRETGEKIRVPSYVCVLSLPFALSNGGEKCVGVYDGTDTKNVPLSCFRSNFLNDEVHQILIDAKYDVDKALEKVKTRFTRRLHDQPREREIELLVSFKKVHREDIYFMYQSLMVQNRIANIPERSVKEVIDFYHRFAAKEAVKIGNKLVRMFRRADEKLGRTNVKAKVSAVGDERPTRKSTKIAAAIRTIVEASEADNPPTALVQKSNVFEDNHQAITCISVGDASIRSRFRSPDDAAEKLNVAQVGIINCLKKRQTEAFGFFWYYDTTGHSYGKFIDDEQLLKHKVEYDSKATIGLECVDSDGTILERFANVRDAAANIKILSQEIAVSTKNVMRGIFNCCSGTTASYLSLRWRYYDSSSCRIKFNNSGPALFVSVIKNALKQEEDAKAPPLHDQDDSDKGLSNDGGGAQTEGKVGERKRKVEELFDDDWDEPSESNEAAEAKEQPIETAQPDDAPSAVNIAGFDVKRSRPKAKTRFRSI